MERKAVTETPFVSVTNPMIDPASPPKISNPKPPVAANNQAFKQARSRAEFRLKREKEKLPEEKFHDDYDDNCDSYDSEDDSIRLSHLLGDTWKDREKADENDRISEK